MVQMGEDCVIIICSTEDVVGDPKEEWFSYDAETVAGYLVDYGLEQGKPYVMTHDDCYCIDWVICQ